MTVLKSEVKMGLLNTLGGEFEDALEIAKANKSAYQGGVSALKNAVQKIRNLSSHVKDDLEAKKIKQPAAETALLYISRAADACENLGMSAEFSEHNAGGRIDAYEKVVRVLKTVFDLEASKRAAKLTPEPGNERPRAKGTLKERRRAEEKKTPKKKTTKKVSKKKPKKKK